MKMSKKLQKQNHFALKRVKPLTFNQEDTFRSFFEGQHLLLHGVAGTGKTFISLYLALNEILKGNSSFEKIVILRSVVPSRDMGFLPGNIKEKTRVYEDPYREICDDLFGRGDGYDILRNKGLIEFGTTSYLRGITFRNAIVIVDESQNMNYHELDTVITRIGENCRIIFCGDYRQSDLSKSDRTGLIDFMRIIDNMGCFAKIEFDVNDIVRSALVKNYIVTKLELGFA
jgi:phosphate starvation-inducible protein PhoH